jgi:peptidoglycan/LPS O-acetylase OafA/YrhL
MSPAPRHAFPGLDGLRGVMALCVLIYHAAAISGALHLSHAGVVIGRLVVAVPVFFALSGFVLYRPFAAARYSGNPRPSATRFLSRRVARLIPAYWVAMAVVIAIPGFRSTYAGFSPAAGPSWWRYFFLLQVYSANTAGHGFGHAWTLCVEATFVVLLVGYVALLGRVGSERLGLRGELALLGVLALGSAVLRVASHVSADGTVAFYPLNVTLATNFLFFAVGMALAVIHVRRPGWGLLRWGARHPTVAWGIALASFGGICTVGLPPDLTSRFSDAQWTIEHVGYAVLAFLILAPVVAAPATGGPVGAFLRSPPLQLLGRYSYGIYLSHLPLLFAWRSAGALEHAHPFLVITALTAPSAVVYGALSWHLVESPSLRLIGRRGRAGGRRPGTVPDPAASEVDPQHADTPVVRSARVG